MFSGFVHPFSCLVAGPSQSGKTVFISKILKSPHLYIHQPLSRIVWCYGVKNENQIAKLENISHLPIEFVEGLPEMDDVSLDGEKVVVVLDDLMNSAGKSNNVADLFTKGCHHRDLSVILTLQNFFHQGRSMRDVHTSCLYNILMKNPRDMSFIHFAERQMFPDKKNYLVDSYKLATERPYGYLGIDLCQETPDEERLFTNIFPGEGVFSHFKYVK